MISFTRKRQQVKQEVATPSPAPSNPLKCDVCGKEFTHKLALAGHKRGHK